MAQLLVGYGPHHRVADTLRWSAGFAEACDLDLVIVHSIERVDEAVEDGFWNRMQEKRLSDIERLARDVTTRPFAVQVLDGEPHDALTRRSNASDVAFVVVGRHQDGGMGGFGGVGTALHLIRHGRNPTIILHEPDRPASGPILVGVDGSDANKAAVEVAEDLAARLDVGIDALFCPDPLADTFPHPAGGWVYPHEREVRAELAPGLAPHVELIIQPGHPTEMLAKVAMERSSQMIVVGTRGRGGFGGLLAGRVATQLVDHAPVPLVVVPHGR